MRSVLQRVKKASVTIDGTVVGRIDQGLLILLGVHTDDTPAQADWMAAKCAELRIFDDESGTMNRSLLDIGAAALVVSQFTLLADCRKGRRPSYNQAAGPERGTELYEYFVARLRERIPKVETGVFGAMMDVALVNDGPVTIILERQAQSD
ncbi:MAG: D-tyrosyl-tRNA(Tyr) deacylase [Chitinivibrionales bacterium]|nr:D-tyrosyl-tRNA(Tyr) deacylase [Chitinivibrionales bacterium]